VRLLLRATLLLRLRPLLRTQALLLRLGFPSSKTKRHGLTSVAFCHSSADLAKASARSKPVIATRFGFEAQLLKRGY
jgi:hypothetical protein